MLIHTRFLGIVIAHALAGPGLAWAQVSTSTTSLSEITLTGSDLDLNDAYTPLAFDMGSFLFSYNSGGAGVVQNAALPYAAMTAIPGVSLVTISNDGAGQIALTSTATGSGANVSASSSIAEIPPLVINPQTSYTLSFSYLLNAEPSSYNGSSANSYILGLIVMVRPGLTTVGSNFYFNASVTEQGSYQTVLTNDSDIAGTLVLRFTGHSDATAGVVPEPASYALMLAGLVLTIGTARRQRRPSMPAAGTPGKG